MGWHHHGWYRRRSRRRWDWDSGWGGRDYWWRDRWDDDDCDDWDDDWDW
jgi:hypothetical protein